MMTNFGFGPNKCRGRRGQEAALNGHGVNNLLYFIIKIKYETVNMYEVFLWLVHQSSLLCLVSSRFQLRNL